MTGTKVRTFLPLRILTLYCMVEQEMRGTGYSRKIRKLCRCSQGDTSYKKTCMPDLWDMNEYFQIMNTTDSSVIQALKVLNEGAYEKVVRL